MLLAKRLKHLARLAQNGELLAQQNLSPRTRDDSGRFARGLLTVEERKLHLCNYRKPFEELARRERFQLLWETFHRGACWSMKTNELCANIDQYGVAVVHAPVAIWRYYRKKAGIKGETCRIDVAREPGCHTMYRWRKGDDRWEQNQMAEALYERSKRLAALARTLSGSWREYEFATIQQWTLRVFWKNKAQMPLQARLYLYKQRRR
jgi:hypothetical protein